MDPRDNKWIDVPGSDVSALLHTKLLTQNHIGLIQTANPDISRVKLSKDYKALETQSRVRGKKNESEIAMWFLIAEELYPLGMGLQYFEFVSQVGIATCKNTVLQTDS